MSDAVEKKMEKDEEYAEKVMEEAVAEDGRLTETGELQSF